MSVQINITGPPPTAFGPVNMIDARARDSDRRWRKIPVLIPPSSVHRLFVDDSGLLTKPEPLTRLKAEALFTLEVENEDGRRAALKDLLFEIPGDHAGGVTLKSKPQDHPWQFSLMIDLVNRGLDVQLGLDFSGLSVAEAVEASHFYESLASGGYFRVFGRHPVTNDELLILGSRFPKGIIDAFDPRFMRILDYLVFIQDKTRECLRIPQGTISPEDSKTIEAITHILETGRANYKSEPWFCVSNLDQVKYALETFEKSQLGSMTVHYDNQTAVIFGTSVALGPVKVFCKRMTITDDDLKELKSDVENNPFKSSFRICFTPVEGCPVEARYIRWLPMEEARVMGQQSMYKKENPHFDKKVEDFWPGNSKNAIALLESWYDEDTQEQIETWENLKTALDMDRLSQRKLFP